MLVWSDADHTSYFCISQPDTTRQRSAAISITFLPGWQAETHQGSELIQWKDQYRVMANTSVLGDGVQRHIFCKREPLWTRETQCTAKKALLLQQESKSHKVRYLLLQRGKCLRHALCMSLRCSVIKEKASIISCWETCAFCQFYVRCQPELRLTMLVLHMDVHSWFFTREKIKPETGCTKNRRTHLAVCPQNVWADSLCDIIRKFQIVWNCLSLLCCFPLTTPTPQTTLLSQSWWGWPDGKTISVYYCWWC